MIQRIQSVWLFLAALASGGLFISPLYKYDIPGIPGLGEQAHFLTAARFYPLLLIAAVMTLLPLIAIFMFKERKKQKGMAIGALLACIAFIGVMIMRIGHIKQGAPAPTNDQYLIPGALLPVLAIVFLILAMRGIAKDDKLVKSMDRLR